MFSNQSINQSLKQIARHRSSILVCFTLIPMFTPIYRKLLTPSFHFSILDHFLTIMNEHANILINIINERIKQGNEYLDVVPLITNATLDVIAETAMGVKIDSQRAKNDQYVQTLTR